MKNKWRNKMQDKQAPEQIRQPNTPKCLECGAVLAPKQFKAQFCSTCDPAISSDLDEVVIQ